MGARINFEDFVEMLDDYEAAYYFIVGVTDEPHALLLNFVIDGEPTPYELLIRAGRVEVAHTELKL